ncbi:UNVERIFIED_CONTAM: class I tRNA ligase family protein [Campylobacter lari]
MRNTLKFLLGNLDGFNYDASLNRTGVHAYVKAKLEEFKQEVIKAYDEYKFINVIKIINNYVVDLSSFYLNISKDILYVESKNSINRLMIQTNFYEITDFLIKVIAPILPTTAEDAYRNFNKENKALSVHLETLSDEVTLNHDLVKQ